MWWTARIKMLLYGIVHLMEEIMVNLLQDSHPPTVDLFDSYIERTCDQ